MVIALVAVKPHLTPLEETVWCSVTYSTQSCKFHTFPHSLWGHRGEQDTAPRKQTIGTNCAGLYNEQEDRRKEAFSSGCTRSGRWVGFPGIMSELKLLREQKYCKLLHPGQHLVFLGRGPGCPGAQALLPGRLCPVSASRTGCIYAQQSQESGTGLQVVRGREVWALFYLFPK